MKQMFFTIALFITITCSYAQINWVQSNNGFNTEQYTSHFAMMDNGDILLSSCIHNQNSSTYKQFLYKSTNVGMSWTLMNPSGLSNMTLPRGLVTNDEVVVYCGGDLDDYYTCSIYTSTDNGQNWKLSENGYNKSHTIMGVTAMENDDFVLLTSAKNPGTNEDEVYIYKSKDNGQNWSLIASSGLEEVYFPLCIGSFDDKLILGAYQNSGGNDSRIYISHNEGENWALSDQGFVFAESPSGFTITEQGEMYMLSSIFDNNSSKFIPYLYKSENKGASWSKINVSGFESMGLPYSILANENTLIAGGALVDHGTGSSIYKSTIEDWGVGIIHFNGSLNFEGVEINTNETKSLMIENVGTWEINISSITYPEGFSGSWQSGTIPAGDSKEVEVTFSPTEVREYTGVITVHSNAGGGENTINVSGTGLSDPTSMNEDPSELIIKVYPNPAKENICIEVEEELLGEEFQLVNTSGQMILSGVLNKEKIKLRISHLHTGVYYLKLQGVSVKVVKI